jgi:hypothetical protein
MSHHHLYSLCAALLALVCCGSGCGGCDDAAQRIIEPAPFEPLFDTYLDQPTGMDAEWVVLADIDEDGTLDQVVAVQREHTVAVLPGYGDGTFGPGRTSKVGHLPTCVSVEDFDRDGHLDLAVATTGDGEVSTWLGDGQGGFRLRQRQRVFTESRPLFEDEEAWFDLDRLYALEILRAADLTGDGVLDLVAGRAVFPDTMGQAMDLGRGVALLRGVGDGSFEAPQHIDTGGNAVGVSLADLDGDGWLDLSVSHRLKGEVSTFRNIGGGDFEPWSTAAVGRQPVFIEAADLDADGDQDLVVVNRAGDSISILLGDGDGSFAPAVTMRAGDTPDAAAIADLDADGLLDIAVANGGSPPLLGIYRGLGEGRFADPVELPSGHCGNHPAIGDLDADGTLDVVVANSSSFSTSTYLGRSDGLSGPAIHHLTADSLASAFLDWDQDGTPELFLAHPHTKTLSRLWGGQRPWPGHSQEIGVLGQPHDLAVLPPVQGEPPVLVVSLPRAHALALLTALPEEQPRTALIELPGVQPLAIASGDIDGDGLPELVVFDGETSRLGVLSDAGGRQYAHQRWSDPLPARVSDLVVHDLGDDGAAEILVSLQEQDRVVVLDGEDLRPRSSHAVGVRPVALLIQDLNADGRAELITANMQDDGISVLPGLPGGGLGAARHWRACRNPVALASSDVDHDGHVDLAVACFAGNSTALLLGDGAGGFDRRQIYGAGFEPSAVLLTDLDRDGLTDLLTTSGSYSFERTVHPVPPHATAATLSVAWGL